MSSVKTWGIDTHTGDIVNIRSCVPREDFVDRIKCTQDSCNCRLILNQGTKKDWYFRHPTNVKGGCSGASVESVLHKYAKQVLLHTDRYTVPDGKVFFKKDREIVIGAEYGDGFYLPAMKNVPFSVLEMGMTEGLSGAFGRSAEKEICSGLRPDVLAMIYVGGQLVVLCFEIYVTNKVSAAKLEKYKKYIKEHSDRKVYVIEVDLSGKGELFDTEGFKDEWLSNQHLIMSNRMYELQAVLDAARFEYKSGKVLCPAHNEQGVVLSRNCSKCPFYVNSGLCYGKGLIASEVDLKLDLESRYDKYSEDIPKAVGTVDYRGIEYPFGRCRSCNDGEYMLIRGADSKKVLGVPAVKSHVMSVDSYLTNPNDDRDAYLMCKSCGYTDTITCPDCGRHKMRVYAKRETNSRGMHPVFLTCPDFEGCNCSITVFNNETAKPTIADEIIVAGGLDKFLNSRTFKVTFKRIKQFRKDRRIGKSDSEE